MEKPAKELRRSERAGGKTGRRGGLAPEEHGDSGSLGSSPAPADAVIPDATSPVADPGPPPAKHRGRLTKAEQAAHDKARALEAAEIRTAQTDALLTALDAEREARIPAADGLAPALAGLLGTVSEVLAGRLDTACARLTDDECAALARPAALVLLKWVRVDSVFMARWRDEIALGVAACAVGARIAADLRKATDEPGESQRTVGADGRGEKPAA